MRIVHYTDNIKAGNLISDYILRLAEAQKELADVCIVTAKDDWKKAIENFKPDLLHVHGCWSHRAASIIKWAKQKHYALVLSPHWGLNAFTLKHEKRMRKLLWTILYQRASVNNVDALLVTTEREKLNLEKEGWKKRIDVVTNSLLNRSLSDTEMATLTIKFYHKVMDTRYQLALTSTEYNAMNSLLYAAISQDPGLQHLSTEQMKGLDELQDEQWRRLFLYAKDEGVSNLLDEAIMRLQVQAPQVDTEQIERYQLYLPKSQEGVNRKKIEGTHPLFRQRLKDNSSKSDEVIREIATTLVNTKFLNDQHIMALRHLTDLYTLIKYSNYDEDKLAEVLKSMKIYRFSRRIIQLLVERLYLEEGFRPIPPLDDRGTRKIVRDNFIQRH